LASDSAGGTTLVARWTVVRSVGGQDGAAKLGRGCGERGRRRRRSGTVGRARGRGPAEERGGRPAGEIKNGVGSAREGGCGRGKQETEMVFHFL
jgi:hypothetical protein